MAMEWNPTTGRQMAVGEPTIAREQMMRPAVMPGTGGLDPMPMKSAVMPQAPQIDTAKMEMLKQQMAKPAVMPPATQPGFAYAGGSPTFNESAGSQTIGQPMPAPSREAPIGATPPGADTGGMSHVMWEGPGNPTWEARQRFQQQIQPAPQNPYGATHRGSGAEDQARLGQMAQNQRMQIPHMGYQAPQPQMMQPPGNAYGKGGQQGGMQNAAQQGFQSRMAGAMGGMGNQAPSDQPEPTMTNDMGMGGQPQTPPGLQNQIGGGMQNQFGGMQQRQQPGKGGAMGGYTPPNNFQRPSYGAGGKGGQQQQPQPPSNYAGGKGGGYQRQAQPRNSYGGGKGG